MQGLEIDAEQDTIESTIDICLHLTYFRNLTPNKLGPVQIIISALCQDFNIAIPYQVISKKTYKSSSKIDLQTYSSPFYILNPYENSIIDEIIIFKIHVPIDQVQTGKIKVIIGLQTLNELAFEDKSNLTRLESIQLNFSSIMYVDSFFPCLFSSYGISLEGNIYTHLLSCKYGNLNNIYRHHFYQTIDHLVICYNKLREKINLMRTKQHTWEIQEETLPLFIDMKKYVEYDKIKGFIEKRIFKQQTMKQHKLVLHKFIAKFIPQMTQKLLILWKQFLKFVIYSMTDLAKLQFYENLGLQLKKRVQYKAQGLKLRLSKSQIKSKNYFGNQNFGNSTLQNSHASSLTKSQVSENCTFTQKEILAQNDLRQRFQDKNLYNSYRKLYISNLQFAFPSLKVFVNKSLKSNSNSCIQTISQPHIIVLVHGLGATSNAFNQFEQRIRNIYSENIFILNSVCNQCQTNEQIQQMGRKLAIQVTFYISQNEFGQNFQLSFIGHSLGGLIVRSALPRLQMYRFNMKFLMTLSTPHLGYFYHNSTLNKVGMWAISKISDNQVINNLLMSDSKNANIDQQTSYRESFLFKLSLKPGMGWFQHIMLCGSSQDYFVSPLSALISTKGSIEAKKDLKSTIWQQMRLNIEEHIGNSNVNRLLIQFNEDSSTTFKDQILGRKSHIMYLSSEDFITYILLAFKHFFV